MAFNPLRGDYVLRQLIDIHNAAHIIKASHAAQLFRDRQDICAFPCTGQIQNRLINDRILLTVEILGMQHVFRHFNGIFVQKHRAENCHFRFYILWRHPSQYEGFGIIFLLQP